VKKKETKKERSFNAINDKLLGMGKHHINKGGTDKGHGGKGEAILHFWGNTGKKELETSSAPGTK